MSEESKEDAVSTSLLLKNSFRELMKGTHTMLPGIIESFDAGDQTAKINLATAQELEGGAKLSFPPLTNVPVQFFRWGGYSITMPVNPGDQCAVFFSERSMDAFLSQGSTDTIPLNTRFFDLSDGFAVSGLYSSNRAISSFDTDNLEIRSDDGDNKIVLGDDGTILLENPVLSIEGNLLGKLAVTNGFGELLLALKVMTDVIAAEELPAWAPPSQAAFLAAKIITDSFV